MSRYDPARDCFTTDPAPSKPAASDQQYQEHQEHQEQEQQQQQQQQQLQQLPPSALVPLDLASLPATSAAPLAPFVDVPAATTAASTTSDLLDPSSPSKTSSPSSSRKRKLPVSGDDSSAPLQQPPNDGKPVKPVSSSPPKIKRRKHGEHAPRFRIRTPPPVIPKPVVEDPTPPPSRAPSPPRKRKRPGQSSRLSEREKELAREAQRKREEEERRAKEEERRRMRGEQEKMRAAEQVRSHYNEKRELGRAWRETSSRIKGLRSFNNWVKSSLIQKFSPSDNFDPKHPSHDPNDHLVILDMGCGKGGDLLKWKSAPQEVGFYLGVDTADVSIAHARDRYDSMSREARERRRRLFRAEFYAMDCWTNSVSDIEIARRIGVDSNVGPGASLTAARWSGGGGFDVVTMMFCMHYAFETEAKCRTMLRNVAGALKKGGRFIGTIPSSDVISARVQGKDKRDTLPENPEHGIQEWGNSIYRVKFTDPTPRSGTFRPSWGWKYNFFLEEAVEEVPEYVVPWEAFRGLTEDYGLALEYRRNFWDVWGEEKDDPEMRRLSERMGVRDRITGKMTLGNDEWEAVGFYTTFAFRKT